MYKDGVKHRLSATLVISDEEHFDPTVLSSRIDLKSKVFSSFLLVQPWSNYILEDLLKKNHLEKCKVRILACLHKRILVEVRQILKAELLDENNNVIDTAKVAESEMPVKFRGSI